MHILFMTDLLLSFESSNQLSPSTIYEFMGDYTYNIADTTCA